MVEELKMVIASHPNAEDGILSMEDLLLFFSIKQNWFTAQDARTLIEKAIFLGLLQEEDDMLKIAFTLPKKIPPFFSPSEDLPSRVGEISKEDAEMDVVKEVLRRLEEEKISPRKAMEEINAIQKRCGLDTEVVAIAYGKSMGAKVMDLVEKMKDTLSKSPPD